MDLARAKTELSLITNQKLQSCSAERRRQRERQKKSIGIISHEKKNVTSAAHVTFMYISLPFLLHDYNVKLAKISSLAHAFHPHVYSF